jgi:hypothetical protein
MCTYYTYTIPFYMTVEPLGILISQWVPGSNLPRIPRDNCILVRNK